MEAKQDLYPRDWTAERAEPATTNKPPARRRRKEHSVNPVVPARQQSAN